MDVPKRLRSLLGHNEGTEADEPHPVLGSGIESAADSPEPTPSEPAAVPADPEPKIEVAVTTAPEFDREVPRGVQVAAAWAWRAIVIAGLIYGVGWLFRYFSEILIPLAVAILLTALLLPVTNRLRKWGVPRGGATAITVLGGLLVIVGVLTLITSQIVSGSASLSGNVVGGFNKLIEYLKTSPLHIDQSWFDLDKWGERITKFLTDSRDTIATYAGEITTQVGHFFAGLAIMLFSLFYFLHDGRGIFNFLLKFFPASSRARVDAAASRGWKSLSSYVRATILVAFTDALGVLIAALIIGVPLAPALAALVFIGAFVPIVGALVSGFVAVLIALVALGWVKALIMLACLVLVMQIEGHVLQPFLLGRAVKLHPLAVIFGIAAGIIVGGIVGALMAVPLLAFTKTFVQRLAGEDEPVIPPRARWPVVRRKAPPVVR